MPQRRLDVPRRVAQDRQPRLDQILRTVPLHEEMAALTPASRLAVIAGSGHMLAMKRPGAVTKVMRDWLRV